jgi:hypothetical protein
MTMAFEVTGMTAEDRANWQAALGLPITVIRALTSAEIKTLFSIPIEVIAAPGSGKVVLLETLWYTFQYGTVAYDTGGPTYYFAPFFDGQDATMSDVAFSDNFTATEDYNGSQVYSVSAPSAGMDNKAMMIGGTIDFAAGDGTAVFGCSYRIFDLSTGQIV